MATKITDTVREKIVKQALLEIAFARSHKRKKVTSWHENEQLLYGDKPKGIESRANVDLGRGAEFVHTFLSKIDNPLDFEFVKRKDAQAKRVRRLNGLKEQDASEGYWDLKDIAGKKQMITYGRAIFSYYASSIDGVYRSCNENVDVYDFLIDPKAGGIDIERARFLGDQGVEYDRFELAELKDEDGYVKSEINKLLKSNGSNNTVKTIEETDKDVRSMIVEGRTDREMPNPDKFKFWRWGTTFEGERYYLLFEDTGGRCIRICKLTDMFPATEDFPKGPWWYWTYAGTIDLTEFWTPAPISQVKDIFFAQNITVNQMLDNGEEYNKPMKIVNVGAIENLAELKYRREGIIKSKNSFEVDKVVQYLRPSPIQTPLMLFDKLEQIQEKASGVTADSKGVSTQDRVAIYEGNQQAAADRYGLYNKSYAFGYKRLARLYEMGVRFNLTKKQAIKIIGPDGIEQEEVSKRDIFRKDECFDILVRASDAEEQLSTIKQKTKNDFLFNNIQNPVQNQQKAYELGAKNVGFKEQEIRELLDTTTYAESDVVAEADRDIENILDGKRIQPNLIADLTYKQRFVDYLRDHVEDMKAEQFSDMTAYIRSIEQIVVRNTVAQAQRKISKMKLEQAAAIAANGRPVSPGDGGAPTPVGTPDTGGLPIDQPITQ